MNKEIKEEESFVCSCCEDTIEGTNSFTDHEGNLLCESCYDDDYFTCNDCGEIHRNDNSYSYNDDQYCSDCFNESFFYCSDCGESCHNDDMVEVRGHYYCSDCAPSTDPLEVIAREYSKKVILDNTKGDYIKSSRIYSIELEMNIPDNDDAESLGSLLPETCGISGDGSVDGNNALEIQTPPLQGKRGEEYIKEVTGVLSKCGAEVNRSCGFHIHLDCTNEKEDTLYLKRLMQFCFLIDDVILSTLPVSRRDNRYCYPFSNVYSLKDIESIDLYNNGSKNPTHCVEKVFYKEYDAERIASRKKQKYDDARYAGVNLHSLFKDGHIEIRFHSGTVDYDKIIHWLILWTTILDFLHDKDRYELEVFQKKMTRALLLAEKTKLFFDFLPLPEKTKLFYLKRQKDFSPSDEKEEKEGAKSQLSDNNNQEQ